MELACVCSGSYKAGPLSRYGTSSGLLDPRSHLSLVFLPTATPRVGLAPQTSKSGPLASLLAACSFCIGSVPQMTVKLAPAPPTG